MENPYASKKSAETYLEFLSSKNGQIQQKVLLQAITAVLPRRTELAILDAGCGPGWLTKALSEYHPNTQGCDGSGELIKFAKKHYRGIEFKVADLEQPLPYSEASFDAIVMNMVAIDLMNLEQSFAHVFKTLKPAGQFIVTIPNPYYTYPVAEWKRGWLRFLLGQKPILKFKQPYRTAANIAREFSHGQTIGSNFYPLSDYVNCGRKTGFTLVNMKEIMSDQDSPEFDLQYQLHRYPLLLLLEFAKPANR